LVSTTSSRSRGSVLRSSKPNCFHCWYFWLLITYIVASVGANCLTGAKNRPGSSPGETCVQGLWRAANGKFTIHRITSKRVDMPYLERLDCQSLAWLLIRASREAQLSSRKHEGRTAHLMSLRTVPARHPGLQTGVTADT
jgi:hypothetical protein